MAMRSEQNHFETAFPEAYSNFDVELLFADLAKALNKTNLMPGSKVSLMGKLCGYDPAETARKLSGYTSNSLRQALSKEIYPAIKELLQLEEEIDWKKADLPNLLELYRKKSQKSLNIDISRICEQLRDRCGELLQHQKGLSTNSLMARDGVTFEVDDLFVPLGLVERKKPSQHKDINSTEQGSIFYAPSKEEINRRFEEQKFFEEVIRDRKTPKSQGQRIVIIGEPGAGKTTLLQKIGDELQKNKTIPIWISLSRVASKPLSKYLLEDWLRDAAQALETAPAEWKTALEELLKTGQICLLLDGADEMTVGANERTPLLDIGCQLREGWANKVRVILTCRLNVWGNNALEEFDVYRTLNFDYPTQVEQFIDNFFNRESVDSQLANDLKAELQLETKARIRDLVKNPLRLSLLCYAWELGIGSLPDTKAELYELFVQAFYRLHELKDSKLKVPFEKQEELKKALGNLSKEALDSKEFRFLLPQSFIETFLGNPNDEKSLFWLAIKQLSWLNCVGRIAEKPFENAYAFFHPTFQEYFAALAIDDWNFFLNHVPENPERGTYRIFEPQWKEVTLLWLGLKKVKKEQKEQFIKALVNFDDGCEKFYHYRAYFLAASGIAEFTQYPLADEIIDKLVDLAWNTGCLMSFGDTAIADAAKAALEETDSNRIIKPLNQLLQIELPNDLLKRKFLEICRMLGKINGGKSKAIKALYELIRSYKSIDIVDKSIKRDALDILREIETDQNQDNQGQIQAIKDDEQSDLVANLIIDLGSNKREPLSKQEAFYQINKLAENSYIPPGIIGLLKNMLAASDETSRLKAAKIIEEVYSGDSYFIDEEPRSQFLWHCAQNISYPEFYQAWHEPTTTHLEAPNNIPVGKSSITQNLNFTQLPSILDSVIANDEELNKVVKLICIDGSYFSDLNNPATDIYIEMVEQGCPEKQEEPNTMQQLKKYWRLDLRKPRKTSCFAILQLEERSHPKPILPI